MKQHTSSCWKPAKLMKTVAFLKGTSISLSNSWKEVAQARLETFLDSSDLMPTMQSAYRRFHSTETAVLKIYNDLLLAADNGDVSALCLLDLLLLKRKLIAVTSSLPQKHHIRSIACVTGIHSACLLRLFLDRNPFKLVRIALAIGNNTFTGIKL